MMTTIPMQIPNISNKSLIAASSWPFAINAHRQALFPVLRLAGLDVEELQCLLQAHQLNLTTEFYSLALCGPLQSAHFGLNRKAQPGETKNVQQDEHCAFRIDSRKLASALRIAAEGIGAIVREHTPIKEISITGGRADGVILADETRVWADVVVLAAGAWSRGIAGLPQELRPPVRPVKGQMLGLRMDPTSPLLNHVVWAPGVYLVPRRDGRLIVAATVEEKAFDTSLTAGGVLTLLEAGWRAVPSIEELPIEEMWVGHRPGSRDDAPILGRGPVDGLIYATGHHRNGILLAPVTADAMARFVLEGAVESAIRPFGFERFASAQAAE
jgi:glycine/D-amino acid oxidase-like deaminating enzyme